MLTLTTALVESGYAVTAAMPLDHGNVEADDFRRHGVSFAPLSSPSPTAIHRVLELSRLLEAESPTLVHAHGSRAAFWTYLALRWARLSSRTPLVVSVHGFAVPFHRQPRRLLQAAVMRRVCHRAAATIACAEAERTALLAARMAPRDKVRVVHYGIDLSAFTRLAMPDRVRARELLGVAPDVRLALIVCRLARPRDFQSLLRAFRGVVTASPRSSLFIVGGGPLRSEIEALLADLELEDRVKLWGFRRDVTRFYAAADAYILTSWGWEGLPTSVIEAQAAGIPAIVTDAGGSAEAIDPGSTGLLVPRHDPDALGAALQQLLGNDDEARAMGIRARQFAMAHFDTPRMLRKMRDIYAHL